MEAIDPRILIEHRAFLRRLAGSLLRDEHAAEDVAQETAVRALSRPPRPGNLGAWLGRVARNLSVSRLRADARRGRRERAVAASGALPPVDESLARLEEQRRVVAVVLDLPEPYRSTIIHRFFDDLGPTEIAERSGVPRETVKTRLRRALDMIRERLDADHRGDRRAWAVLLLPAPFAKGAVLVGTKVKIAAAAVVLAVIAGLGIQQALRSGDPSVAPAPPAPPPALADSGDAADTAPPPAVAPAAVDLAAVDRDRDLLGTVVDDAGNPVADADLRAVRHRLAGIAGLLEETLPRWEGPGTTSGPDGTFALRLERGEHVDIEVRADGWAPVVRPDAMAGERVKIVLSPGVSLTIRAVDEDREPVAGVHLLFPDFGRGRGDADTGLWLGGNGVTGADGKFTFPRAIARSRLVLVAWHERFGVMQVEPFRIPESGDYELVLAAGRPLTGTVRDAVTDEPVAGATVSTIPFFDWFTVTTDAEGRFSWPAWRGGFAENLRSVFVRAEGYPFHQRLVGSDEKELAIRLEHGGRVEGRLVRPDGAPVAEALLLTEGKDGSDIDYHLGRSGADGRFAIAGLAPRYPHTLTVLAPGRERKSVKLDPPPAADEVRALGDLVLTAGGRIEGRVLDVEGNALPGETVRIEGTRESCRTDDLGRYRFRNLPPGDYVLSVRPVTGMSVTRTVPLTAGQDVLDADLRPKVGGGFEVRVTDEAGRAVVGATVAIGVRGGRPTAKTGPDGWARVDVPTGEGEAYMTVSPPEGRKLLRVSRRQSLDLGGGPVVLVAAGDLAGIVLDSEGEPLPYAVVVARWGERGSAMTPSDAEGRFRFQVPATARVDLSLTGQVAKEHRQIAGRLEDVPAGSEDLVLRARKIDTDRTLRIRVLSPDGEPVAGARLSVTWARTLVKTDAGGTAEVTDLPARTTNVSPLPARPGDAWADWAEPERVSVVPDGQEVILRFREAVSISGTVRLPDGGPAYVVVVALDEAGGSVAGTGTHRENGTFTLQIPQDHAGPVTLEILPSNTHVDPIYKELSDVRLPGVEPGTTGIEVRLEKRR